MDISLLCWNDPTYEVAYQVGDVVDCSLGHSDPCDHPRFFILNLTGLPDTLSFERVKREFESGVRVFRDATSTDRIRNRRWRLSLPRLRNPEQREITNTRRLAVDWNRAQGVVARKVVVEEGDPSRDTEVLVTEDDLRG